MRRGPLAFLTAMAVILAVTISIVLLRPPPNHGYLPEQVGLLLLALVALGMLCANESGAVFLYCSLALLPVLSMLEHHHNTIDDAWALVYVVVPFFGLGFVTLLTKSDRGTLAYGAIAFLFAIAVGAVYDKPGLAGILCALSAMATGGALIVLDCSRMKAQKKLDELRGEASKLDRIITKELAQHDP